MTPGSTPVEELQTLLQPEIEKAFTRIYEEYHAFIYFVAYKMLQNSEDAKDAVQAVFMTVWKNDKIREVESWGPYLRKVCESICRRQLDKRSARKSAGKNFEKIAPDHQDEHFSESFQMRDHFIAAYNGLTARQRHLVSLLYFQNCSYSQAAHRMGLNVNTIKSYRRNVLQVLRNKLIRLIT